MQQSSLQELLDEHWQRRVRVGAAVKELGVWLEASRKATPKTRAWTETVLASLSNDRLCLAFLSAGGQDRAALIDSLCRDDAGRRVLPSTALLTSRCPTETCWDAGSDGAYLALLPIETQEQAVSFARLRAEPAQWYRQPLDPQDPEETARRLDALSETTLLTPAEAQPMCPAAAQPNIRVLGGTVEVPRWRHGVISYPNALLRLGLTVVDVPYLERSEVSTHLLSQARVVVWVLAADQLADAGQLDLARERLQTALGAYRDRLVVALSQVGPTAQVPGAMTPGSPMRRARLAAELGIELGLDAAQIFPVWPRLALDALERGDQALLHQSGIEALRAQILTGLVHWQHPSPLDALQTRVEAVLAHHRAKVSARMELAKGEIGRLESLGDECRTLLADMLDSVRQEQERSLRAVRRLARAQAELATATQACRDILDRGRMDALIAQVQGDLGRRWTTAGMANLMIGLFDELARAMQTIASETQVIRQLLRRVYDGFARDFGFEATVPQVFVARDFHVEIDLLYHEVDEFRRSPALALSGRAAAIKRFDQEMVVRARILFEQLRATCDAWVKEACQPLAARIQEHQTATERRLEKLQRLGRSGAETARHLDEAQARHAELARQLAALRNIHRGLDHDLTAWGERDANPQGAVANPTAGRQASPLSTTA